MTRRVAFFAQLFSHAFPEAAARVSAVRVASVIAVAVSVAAVCSGYVAICLSAILVVVVVLPVGVGALDGRS